MYPPISPCPRTSSSLAVSEPDSTDRLCEYSTSREHPVQNHIMGTSAYSGTSSSQSREVHADKLFFRIALCIWNRFKFEQSREKQDIDWAIALFRLAFDAARTQDDPDKQNALLLLAQARTTRHRLWGDMKDLERAIALWREGLALCPLGHPLHSACLNNLASCLAERVRESNNADDLEELIALYRASLVFCPLGHEFRPMAIQNLANALLSRFERGEAVGDLEESIALHREAVDLLPEGHPNRSTFLNGLASALQTRSRHAGNDLTDLDESIGLYRTSAKIHTDSRRVQSMSLYRLSYSLWIRFKLAKDVSDLEESISLHRDALGYRPDGDPHRADSLDALAMALSTRYQNSGSTGDLHESIVLYRAALVLRPKGHVDRPSSLSHLSEALKNLFAQRANPYLLDESIALRREAASLLPEDHPDRSEALSALANSLRLRFEQRGVSDDLDESIALHRATLALRPEGHPSHSKSLANLAGSLFIRYRHSRRDDDLEDSIRLYRTALASFSEGRHERREVLHNLAASLILRFDERGSSADIDESITLLREAAVAQSEDRICHIVSLHNLGLSLMKRFHFRRNVEDLDESIDQYRAVLDVLPKSSSQLSMTLDNLAISYSARFEHGGRAEDLEESISLHRSALDLRPEGHLERSDTLYGLANSLCARYRKGNRSQDFEDLIGFLRLGANHEFSLPFSRLKAANKWSALARHHDHPSTLEAYRTAMSIIQRILTVRPTLAAQHDLLNGTLGKQILAMDAASYAIEKGILTQAIEILEQGRALLWSQMRGFRTPLDRLSEVNKTLADKFRECSRRLETLMTSSESRSASSGNILAEDVLQGPNQVDETLVRMRRLTEKQNEIINDIRQVPRFEDFLRATSFETLQQAASEGPVIMVNHCKFRCDAIIILSRQDVPCFCVPLDGNWFRDSQALCNEFLKARYEFKVHSVKYDDALRRVMKVLWDRVVAKVVRKLKELGIAEESRIWWCPTSCLTLLPFHAAGPYTDANGKTKYLLDDYISSYTPTLKSLIAARTGIRNGGQKLLFIGDSSLSAAKSERHAIRRQRTIEKYLLDECASRSAVMKALRKVEWVHLACHGILARDPFESALKLYDGKLTLLDIARTNLPNAEFAFLSACHTAEQHPRIALDEALHLAAAIQFCGFRSVVGTMWQLLDRDAPTLSGAVYMHLMRDLEEGEVRFKRAAAAVREAALYLRSRKDEAPDGSDLDIMTERWVNLVHIGA